MDCELMIEGGVATLLLNRPARLNAMTPQMRRDLHAHLDRIEEEQTIRAVILTGAGRGFCSGADRGNVTASTSGATPRTLASRRRTYSEYPRLLGRLYNLEKPVIGAIRGPVVGVGWSFALCCDVLIASETARFSQIFLDLGLVSDGGAIFLLSQQIGRFRAKEIVFSRRFVEAAEAERIGLVNRVVADGELDAAAKAFAGELASMPTYSIGLAKSLFNSGATTFEEFLNVEQSVVGLAGLSADAVEAGTAAREKRKPVFKGT